MNFMSEEIILAKDEQKGSGVYTVLHIGEYEEIQMSVKCSCTNILKKLQKPHHPTLKLKHHENTKRSN